MSTYHPPKTKWMSGIKISEHLGVSRRHVSRLVKQGKIERRSFGAGKIKYRTEVRANVIPLPSPQRSPREETVQAEDTNTSHAISMMLAKIEEQAVEIAQLKAQLDEKDREHDELKQDHANLWDVVGDLTTEAIGLEAKLSSKKNDVTSGL